MSWERSKYEARCSHCGEEGFCIQSSDDWGRSETKWIGFKSKHPDPMDVVRKRTDAGSMVPICECGKSEIVTGKCLGECDYSGKLLAGS